MAKPLKTEQVNKPKPGKHKPFLDSREKYILDSFHNFLTQILVRGYRANVHVYLYAGRVQISGGPLPTCF